ncbi:retrovirus-related pol polyprotein from transposon TNT 1-94 [Tanacetum coccineum]|uniref:Retrovirus-related pol polyprotein from transposon TNT 1-94 n=1 Tax=Tanacetum coccineum TaxID=301880 RepID=A0ABQ4Z9C3_9ASTR
MTKRVTDHVETKKTLVDLPYGKRAIGTKWICRNKKDERVARIEAIRLLSYASFKDFVVYQMDVESAFLYGKIKEEVYVYQPPRFEDLEFPNSVYKVEKALYGLHQAPRAWYETLSTKKELCTEFEKLMHKKFQISFMGELTFFLGLQVTQKDDGIFISQDKYVDEILKKFGFSTVKTASMETSKPLMKDENAKDVDVLWIQNQMMDYGYNFMNTKIFIDNESTICIVKNSVFHSKTKHIEIRHHFIRDSYEERLIQVIKIHTDHNVEDLLTKAFDLEKSEANIDFVEIVDFFNASHISYALAVSAKVDGKTKVIIESYMRRDLHFDDKDGITCLTNTEIFENLQLMGYEKLSDKLTFLKSFFSPQWNSFNDEYDTPSHTKKVFANMRRKGKDFSGIVTPLFPSMLALQVVEGKSSRQPTKPQHKPTTALPSHVEPILTIASLSHPKKTHKHRKTKSKVTEILQSSEPTNLDADESVHEEKGDSVERATTTAASLDAEHDSGNINRTQSMAIPNVPFPQGIGSGGSPRCQEAMRDTIAQTRFERVSTPSYDSPLLGVNIPRSDEERIELKELMDMCTKLSDSVLDLENVKDAQALEIRKLKKRGRNSENTKELNVAEDEHVFDLSNLAGTEVVLEEDPIELVEDKGSAKKGVSTAKDKDSTADPVTTACETFTTTSVNPDDVTLAETLMPEKPVKVKGKDQIEYDADVAQRLQAELDEEARLEREREESSNAAIIEE